MTQQSFTIYFRSRPYTFVMLNGYISITGEDGKVSRLRINKGLNRKVFSMERIRKRVLNFLKRRPDPGMTFSD